MRRVVDSKVLRMAVVLVTLLVGLVLPSRAWADNQTSGGATARVRVFQEYKVSTSGLQSDFDYRIVAQEANAPLPANVDGTSFSTFTLTREEDMWLSIPIPAGEGQSGQVTYHYLLEPENDTLSDGLYYVDVLSENLPKRVNRYYLDINVVYPSDGTSSPLVFPVVHVDGWDGPKITDPGWRVAYEQPDDKGTQGDGSGSGSKNSNGSATNTTGESGTGVATTTGTTGTRQATAQTADSSCELPIAFGLACVLIGMLCRHCKAGDGHA